MNSVLKTSTQGTDSSQLLSIQTEVVRRKKNVRLPSIIALNSLLLVLLGIITHPGVAYLFWVFIIIWFIGACSVLLISFRRSTYAEVLLYALATRLVVLLLIEAFPPISPPSSWRYVPGVIWQDETYYLSQARLLGQSVEQFLQTRWSDPYERVAGLYAFFILLGSDATIWGRLINITIGAITSVILYDAMARVTSQITQRWIFWYAVASPVLLQFSIVYLKEGILVFGVALLVNAAVRVYYGGQLAKQLFKIIIGLGVGLWTRNTTILPLVLPFIIGFVYPWWRTKRSRGSFVPLFFAIFGFISLVAIMPLQAARLASTLFGIQGLGTIELSNSQIVQGTATSSLPLFGFVMQLPEMLRGIGFLFLLLISPIITSVWSLIASIGRTDWWYTYGVASYAISWWISLPFVIRAVYDSIRNRNLWWFAWSASLLIWLLIAANTRFGAGFDAFRYRDSFAPVIMLLAAKGLDTMLCLKEQRKGKMWRIILKLYWYAIALLILMRAVNLIGS